MASLTGAQKRALIDALMAAYPSWDDFQDMLELWVDRKLTDYAHPAILPNVVLNVVRRAESQNWTDSLITGASMGNPGNEELRELIASGFLSRSTVARHALADPKAADVQALLPGAASLDGERARLERIVNTAVKFENAEVYASALLEQVARVCSISVVTLTSRSAGTGFLVGPDLVLTNYHVVRDIIRGASPTGITCTFDYRITRQGKVDNGVRYKTADDWLVASSPMSLVDEQENPVDLPSADELDYALIRLNGEPGRTTDAGGRERGWINLFGESPELTKGMPLLILQHPKEHPIKFADDTTGVLGVNANRTRVGYGVNTLPGSSGSPCFTYRLELVALHHAEGAARTGNEGIPIATVSAHLRKAGHAALLGG